MSEDTVKAEAESPENDVVEQDAVEQDVVEEDATEDTEAKSDPLDEKEKKSAKFPALLIVLLVVLGLIGLSIFSSHYSIDKKAVGNQIADIENVLSKQFSAAGGKLSFNYDAMNIKGGLFSKHIVIDKPRFALKHPDGSQTVITSNALIVEPTSSDGKEIIFHAGDQITLEKNGERYAVASSERLKFKVNNSDAGLRYSLKFPNEINVKNLATNARYAAITAAKGTLNGAVGEASSIAFDVTDATLFFKQRQLIASSLSVKNDYSYKAGAMLSDVTLDTKGASFPTPYNLFGALDIATKISYETASFSEEYGIPSEQNIEINSFTASNGEINTILDGTFQFLENELIPLGNASLKIDGVNALFTTLSRSNILDARGEKVLRNVLDKAAKEWKPEEDGVLIEFQREYGGGFYIGDVTFEELVALALRSYFGTAPKTAIVEGSASASVASEAGAVTDVVDEQQVEAEVKQELQKNGVVIGDAEAEAEIVEEANEANEVNEAKEANEVSQYPVDEAPKTDEVVAETTVEEKPEAVKLEEKPINEAIQEEVAPVVPALDVKEPVQEVEPLKLDEAVKVEEKPITEAIQEEIDSVVPALDVTEPAQEVIEIDKAVDAVESIEKAEEAIEEAATIEPAAEDAVQSDIQAVAEEAESLKNTAKDVLESSPVTETPELNEIPATPIETPEVEKIDKLDSISSKELGLEGVISQVNEAIDEAEQTNSLANNILDELPAQQAD